MKLRELDIAVIGMAGRFPGAPDLHAFWSNLEAGRECISRFGDEALLAAGVPPEHLVDPSFVRAHGVLEGAELFDPGYFEITPAEAASMDPQHRLFLMAAVHALEDAGVDPAARASFIAASSAEGSIVIGQVRQC